MNIDAQEQIHCKSTKELGLEGLIFRINGEEDPDEHAWFYINALCLNSRAMYPDLGNTQHLPKGEGVRIALLSLGICWSDPDFNRKNRRSRLFGEPACRVIQYWDYVSKKVTYPIQDPESLTGTLSAKLIGASNAHLTAVAPNAQLIDVRDTRPDKEVFADVQSSEKVWEIFPMKKNVDVYCGSFWNLFSPHCFSSGYDFYTQRIKKDIENEILVTFPVGDYGRQHLFNVSERSAYENTFSVGEFYLTYRFQLVFRFPLEEDTDSCKSLRAAYLTLRHLPYDTFRCDSAVYLLDTDYTMSSVNEKLQTLVSETVILHCTMKYAFCKQVILMMETQGKVERVILISNQSRHWIHGFRELRMIVILASPQSNTLSDLAPYFESCLKEKHQPKRIQWKMGLTNQGFPALTSSMGPHAGLKIKPDVMVIGGIIPMKTYFPDHPLAYVSATTFANARFSGMLALYVEAMNQQNKAVTFAEALMRAQNTACPYVYNAEKAPEVISGSLFYREHFQFSGLTASVAWQGAGLVNLERMIHTRVVAFPSKLELGCFHPAFHNMKEVQLTLTNQGELSVHYIFKHLPAVALWTTKEKNRAYETIQCTMSVLPHTKDGILEPKMTSLHIPARSSIKLSFLFILPPPSTLQPFTFFSGYLQFQPLSKTNMVQYGPIHVPYLLLYGDQATYPFVHAKLSKIVSAARWSKQPYQYPRAYFEMRQGSSFQRHMFTFHGADRPVWEFMATFPMTNMRLGLKRVQHNDEILGFIHPKKTITFGINDTVSEPNDQERGMGWDGTFFDIKSRHWYKAKSGEYQFCFIGPLAKEDIVRSTTMEDLPSVLNSRYAVENSPKFWIQVENNEDILLNQDLD